MAGVDVDRQPGQPSLIPRLQVNESRATAMRELDDFLATTLARQVEAEQAIHDGDPTPRMQMWSTADPVTLFGA